MLCHILTYIDCIILSINILQTDVVIGFNQTTYDVSEDEPFVVVYIELLSSTLRREVIVNVSTVEDSALGKSMLHSIRFCTVI